MNSGGKHVRSELRIRAEQPSSTLTADLCLKFASVSFRSPGEALYAIQYIIQSNAGVNKV
jgi:hypothetical protein